MGRARSRKERLLQIGRWLCATFDTPYPVTLRIVKKIAADADEPKRIKMTGYYGESWREGRRIYIRIAARPGIRIYDAIDTLLHEFAHAASMRHEKIEDKRLDHGAHDDAWALAWGKIYRKFYDDDGDVDSWDF
ncbi:hypothetical protein LCGC14_1777230 [marine sediment metagenome]|uniref:SprT-like domain-containing protein n=1 Tax=marine sediment metagenome TaxID=412755 RepID=A0A0F9GWM2_9ZZZZ